METWKVMAVDTDSRFKSRQDGKEIAGVKLLLTPVENTCTDRSRFRGLEWMEQFISNERMNALKVAPQPGDVITLIFNRHGSIERIEFEK